jgi:hypothetical protein
MFSAPHLVLVYTGGLNEENGVSGACGTCGDRRGAYGVWMGKSE